MHNPKISESIVILILLTGVLLCCRKKSEDPSPSKVCTLPDKSISDLEQLNAKFKTGSFWIFSDSINNVFDTLKVFSEEDYYDYFGGDECEKLEHHRLGIRGWSIDSEFSEFNYTVMPEKILLTTPNRFMGYLKASGLPIYDSLFLHTRWHLRVYESRLESIKEVKETSVKEVKIFFNVENGILRCDFFDAKNKLVSKKVQISSHVVR